MPNAIINSLSQAKKLILLVLILTSALLTSCGLGEVEYDFTFDRDESWTCVTTIAFSADEVYMWGDWDDTMEIVKGQFESAGATFRWDKSSRSDGGVTYTARITGDSWSILESLYDIDFRTESSNGRDLVHMELRLESSEITRDAVLRIHAPEIVESNADAVTEGTAVWHDPSYVYLVFAQRGTFPWGAVLAGGGCCSILVIVLITWALLLRRQKSDTSPRVRMLDRILLALPVLSKTSTSPSSSPGPAPSRTSPPSSPSQPSAPPRTSASLPPSQPSMPSPTPTSSDQPPAPSISADVRQAIEQGVRAARSGQKSKAQAILHRVIEVEPEAERGWLWLSSVVDDDEERMRCLREVLRINPRNQAAARGLQKLAPAQLESLRIEEQNLLEQLDQEKSDFSEREKKSALRLRTWKIAIGAVMWTVLMVILTFLAYLIEGLIYRPFDPLLADVVDETNQSLFLGGFFCCPTPFAGILAWWVTSKVLRRLSRRWARRHENVSALARIRRIEDQLQKVSEEINQIIRRLRQRE